MNKIILIGNLTRDPELRQTTNGTPVCSFTLAVNRRMANAQGIREADFINCVAWSKEGEFVQKYFTKGMKMALEGRLQIRSYDAQDGTKRTVAEVVAENVEFVTPASARTAPVPTDAPYQPEPAQPRSYQPQPQPQQNHVAEGFAPASGTGDDELPF